MNGPSNPITISLREFIDSDHLSNISLRLVGDYANVSVSTGIEATSSDSNNCSSKLHALNSTKVALLLAKACAKFEGHPSSPSTEQKKETNELESLQFDNFFLKIQLEHDDTEVKNATNLHDKKSSENSSPKVADSRNANGEDDDIIDDDLLKSIAFDAPIQGEAEVNPQDEQHTVSFGPEENKLSVDDEDDDFIDSDLLMSVVFDAPIQRESEVNIPQDDQKALEGNGVVVDGPKLPPPNNIPRSPTWTALDIDIICPAAANILRSNQFTSLQHLGNHILQIYHRGSKQDLSPPNGQTRFQSGGGDISDDPPSSKQKVVNDNSLFSTLIEGGYPVSVCRLLSGMIDTGDTGNADNPLTTLDDVIKDLEQMATHPEIFLYDQDNDFYSSNLLFGQRCYGRVNELTNVLEIATRLEQSHSQSSSIAKAETVFVCGMAGSGKSFFVNNVGSFLENLGWMVLKVKFRRDMKHGSRDIASSLFEDLVGRLVEMKSSSDLKDVDYCRRVSKAIPDTLDQQSLSSLAKFIPNLQQLVPEVILNSSLVSEADMSHWQLVFLLSKLMGVILSLDHRIMLCLDDLQWCDPTTMDLIKEIIVSIGQDELGRHNFLCVGMFRDDEVDESHPLATQLANLRTSSHVAVSEIKLSSLPKEDVVDMLSSEMRLPRRLVQELAYVIHRKTSGYALFAVQLLNALVRDSTITYSPRKLRFDWDESKLSSLKTMESVASLIVSNLSYLQAEELQSLRVLSCFGVQIPLSLVKLLDGCTYVPEKGIESFLPGLSSRGVVEVSGPSVFFCHDLIQQHVYENIPTEERRQLHLGIGTHIATKIGLDSALPADSVVSSVEELKFSERNGSAKVETPSYPLVAIATNQINYASPVSVSDRSQMIRFTRWNLYAGKSAAERSNFQAALYYYKNGISFMGDNLWLDDTHQLSHDLHEGAAFAQFGIGDYTLAAQQATLVIEHVQFEDSLVVQYILIRSMDSLGQYQNGVITGLELLRKLKFDIPSDPSPISMINAMKETGNVLSAYSFNQLTSRHQIVDAKKRNVFKIVEAMATCFYRAASPYLPLVACGIVKYSLSNGICEESAISFMLFGYFKLVLEQNLSEGLYWGKVCLKLLEGTSPTLTNMRAEAMCAMHVMIFFRPLKDSAFQIFSLYQQLMAMGAVESALYALSFSLQISFLGSEKLSVVLDPFDGLITSMIKHSEEGAKMALLWKMLICDLTGTEVGPFPSFEGDIIHDERSLLAVAQSKRNFHMLEQVYLRRFFSAFWMEDYATARSYSQKILALPNSKMIKIQTVFHTFFIGLIHFQTYRDGEGESYMDEGKKVMEKMNNWAKYSPATFENKVHLIEAEYHASSANIQAARAAYEASVRSARDHGLVNEQALACELYAKFLSSIVEHDNSRYWNNCAHVLYYQWGALAKCKKLRDDRNLSAGDVSVGPFTQNKHGRDG